MTARLGIQPIGLRLDFLATFCILALLPHHLHLIIIMPIQGPSDAPQYLVPFMLTIVADSQIMEVQKPLSDGSFTDSGSSAYENFKELFVAILQDCVPPLWARRVIMALIILYFTPQLLTTWLRSLERLVIVCRRWQRADDNGRPA